MSTSEPITVDTTPPDSDGKLITTEGTYHYDVHNIKLNWFGAFQDHESGTVSFF